MLSTAFALAPAARTGAPCRTECPRNDLTPEAVTPPRASLLSSRIGLAGVDRCASRHVRPRERVLRCSSRLLFLRRILRGQPEFRGMRPATPTVSRNQYAPFRGSPKVGELRARATGFAPSGFTSPARAQQIHPPPTCREASRTPRAAIPLPLPVPQRRVRLVKLLRVLLIGLLALTLPACSSWSNRSKSTARMYDGDESPHIRMYSDVEGPGSTLHN
jgi:hypothetical protein